VSAIVVTALGVGWLAAAAAGYPPTLRSAHSQPAKTTPPAMVAVTGEGKLYHKPDCAYIHGPLKMQSGAQAIADGYTPCTHCMPQH
jgi:hypothetical protein